MGQQRSDGVGYAIVHLVAVSLNFLGPSDGLWLASRQVKGFKSHAALAVLLYRVSTRDLILARHIGSSPLTRLTTHVGIHPLGSTCTM